MEDYYDVKNYFKILRNNFLRVAKNDLQKRVSQKRTFQEKAETQQGYVERKSKYNYGTG